MASEDTTRSRMLQTLAVAAMTFVQFGLLLTMPILVFYIIFATKYWWFCVLYFTWSLILDKDADETGTWRSEWVRSCYWAQYVKQYYPFKLVKLPWGELDRKRNYLFCFFPHGVLSVGSYLATGTNTPEFQKYFPHHDSYLHTHWLLYKVPIIRELLLLTGGLQASKKALCHILGKEAGGNISALIVGGAEEVYYCNSGVHRVFYKKRKGFIKIALRQGTPLVPVYVFGENELFSQSKLDGYISQRLKDYVMRTLGFALIIPKGRKDMPVLVPVRTPLTAVVGEPIDVQKTENPTQEQIDHLHKLFQTKLVELFEDQKKYYVKDHETAHLEIC